MKKLIILLFVLSSVLLSCEKINDNANQDENNPYTVLIDSCYTIKTGDTYKNCFQKIQDLYKRNQIINYMYVKNDGFNSINNFDLMITLYSEFWIIDNHRDTIVFSFKKDTIQSLYNLSVISHLTDGPKALEKWPDNTSLNAIKRGDDKKEVFDKLLILKSEG